MKFNLRSQKIKNCERLLPGILLSSRFRLRFERRFLEALAIRRVRRFGQSVHILISALANGLRCLRAASVPDLVSRRVLPGILN